MPRNAISVVVRAARPYADAVRAGHDRVRAILVEAPVSSLKISHSGSRSSWPSNQTSRASLTSGRSCSAACADFFDRDGAAMEEAPQAAVADRDPTLEQGRPEFVEVMSRVAS